MVSGHDLKDLEAGLKQTESKGIYIYTHGNMLPTHGYPGGLKKYSPHDHQLPAGEPKESYQTNVFTTGLVGWPGLSHIADKNFSALIKRVQEQLPGFAEDLDKGMVIVGVGRNAVLAVTETVISAVKSGAIKHFFLIGGCDGAKPGRFYYSDFGEKAPKDTVILTLVCDKFRFFDKKLGDIGGIPLLLDVGQCNDVYSAVQIVLALACAFNCGVNDLPLSLILSWYEHWYEQKAVAILLTLLHLGIKDIRLGPSCLLAFIIPNVLQVLVDNFAIKPISTPPKEDLKAILG